MIWRARLAQLICNHQFEQVATFIVIATGGKINAKMQAKVGKTITTYECSKCGKLIDR